MHFIQRRTRRDQKPVELMGVHTQLLNAQNNKPCMGFVQDALVGAYILATRHIPYEAELCQLMMHIAFPKSSYCPGFTAALILKPVARWSSKQDHNPLILHDHNKDVVIRDGHLLTGILYKQTLGATLRVVSSTSRSKMIGSQVALNFMMMSTRRECVYGTLWLECGTRRCMIDQIQHKIYVGDF
jgi:hypothetical protein